MPNTHARPCFPRRKCVSSCMASPDGAESYQTVACTSCSRRACGCTRMPSRPGVETLFIETAYHKGHPEGDLGIEVAPEQLAYIYFTSGSTGEPKGAMCEHAGLLNHLFAKIDDLKIGAGDAVAQSAPQCF